MLYLLGLPRWGSLELPPTKPVCLLVYLAFCADWVSREALAALFYPEEEEGDARRQLRVMLSRARALPWVENLEVENTRLRWAPPTDVQAFRKAVGRGDWKEALRLHQQPLLEGFRVAGVPGFEAWLELERDGLLAAWKEVALRESAELGRQGEHRQAAYLLHQLLQRDPLAEDVLVAYMEQAYLSGQRDKALKAYQGFAQHLERELGLEPLERTRRLAEQVARAEALSPEAPQPQVSLPLNLQRPPRLVGCEREQRLLLGHGQVAVLVAGEPGVGKTRLLQETFPQASVVQCREGLENLPFYPIIEYLKPRLARLHGLGAYREDVARLIPELSPEPPRGPSEARSARLRLMEGLARALEQEAHPLIFDDLQWADSATLELLLLLVARGRRVLGAYRLGEVHPPLAKALAALRSSQRLLEIRLKPLAFGSLQQLLGDIMGLEQGPPLFARWLHEQSGGNPFFALEVLRTLFERQTLRLEGGVWFTLLDRITKDYSELEVPSQINELVQRRMASLTEATQRVLQAASVLQEGFEAGLLGGLMGLSEMALVEALEEAEQAGLIQETRFVHDLARQSIYASLSKKRREMLHRLWAETLQGRADLLVVAEHWWRGDRPQEAAARWVEVARLFSQRGMYAEALGLLERALAVSDEPESRLLQADALLCVGRYPECRAALERVLPLVRGTPLETQALTLWVHLCIREGRLSEALATTQQLLQLTESGAARLKAVQAFANVAALMGQQAQALPMLEAQLAQMASEPPSGLLASLDSNTGWLLCGLGRFAEALPLYQQALATAKAASDRHWQVWASANLLYCCLELGQPEQALAEAQACLELGLYDGSEILRINLGRAYLDLGRLGEAIEMFEAVCTVSLDPTNRCVALGYLADLYAQTGQQVRALEALREALALAQQTEMNRGRVRVLIAALKYGSEAQVAEAMAWLPQLNRQAVAGYVWRELEETLRAKGLGS